MQCMLGFFAFKIFVVQLYFYDNPEKGFPNPTLSG